MASRWQWLWTGPRLIGGWVGALRDPGPLMSALPCLPPAPATHPQHDKSFAYFPTPAFLLLPHFTALPFLFCPLLPVQEMKEHKDVCLSTTDIG